MAKNKFTYILFILQITVIQVIGVSLHNCIPCGSHVASYSGCDCNTHNHSTPFHTSCESEICTICNDDFHECIDQNKIFFLSIQKQIYLFLPIKKPLFLELHHKQQNFHFAITKNISPPSPLFIKNCTFLI